MSNWVPSHTLKYRTCSMSAVIHVRSWTWCSDTETVSHFSNRFYIFWALVIILSSKDEIFLITLIYLEVWVFPEERGAILTLWVSSSLGSIGAQSIALPLPLTFIPPISKHQEDRTDAWQYTLNKVYLNLNTVLWRRKTEQICCTELRSVSYYWTIQLLELNFNISLYIVVVSGPSWNRSDSWRSLLVLFQQEVSSSTKTKPNIPVIYSKYCN